MEDCLKSLIDINNKLNLFIESKKKCSCYTRWRYPLKGFNPKKIFFDYEFKYLDYFCIESEETLKKCENFKLLVSELPLLNILYDEKSKYVFTEDAIHDLYDKDHMIMILNILLKITEKINVYFLKLVIFFVLIDYLLRNNKFLIDNQNLAVVSLNKFREFINNNNNAYIFALKYNINLKKWLKILKKNIK